MDPEIRHRQQWTTLDEMIAEVRRECAMRRRVYPKWVAKGMLTQVDAQKQIRVMDAVLDELTERRNPKLL